MKTIKKVVAALACCALMSTGAAVQAATTIDTAGFSFSTLAFYGSTAQLDMRVLSDAGGVTRIAMGGLAPTRGPITHEDMIGFGMAKLAASVHQGYRIASLTISGSLAGDYSLGLISPSCTPDVCEAYPGMATNGGAAWMSVTRAGRTADVSLWGMQNITGRTEFSHQVSTDIAGTFELRTDTSVIAIARDAVEYYPATPEQTWDYTVRNPSTAQAQLSDIVMTVEVVPVPEPGTCAMLLAGLGVLAGLAHRRRG